ncbi:hypothetical protein AAEX28_00765 [Lentisphaerota bacterium WC36G]|nr:hypothetical protein LJT99_03645 [Lentisphaerae bacterium WC36]
MRQKKELTKQNAVEILSKMANASIVDILDSELNIDPKKLKKHKHALRELTIKPTKEGNQLQVKMYDKKAIIEQLATLQGWKEKQDNKVDSLQQFLQQIITETGDSFIINNAKNEHQNQQFNFMGDSYEA